MNVTILFRIIGEEQRKVYVNYTQRCVSARFRAYEALIDIQLHSAIAISKYFNFRLCSTSNRISSLRPLRKLGYYQDCKGKIKFSDFKDILDIKNSQRYLVICSCLNLWNEPAVCNLNTSPKRRVNRRQVEN